MSFCSLLFSCTLPFPIYLLPYPLLPGTSLLGFVQSTMHQVEAGLSFSPYVKAGPGNLAWGTGYQKSEAVLFYSRVHTMNIQLWNPMIYCAIYEQIESFL